MHSGDLDEKTETEPWVGAREAAPSVRPTLLVLFRGGTKTFELPVQGQIIVGRSEDADIRLAHASISRRHARLTFGASQPAIEDLGSSNGTFVGGKRLTSGEPMVVPRGAVIEMGIATLLLQSDCLPEPETAAISENDTAPESTMARLDQLVEAVAKSRISVLLLGETGVGKEVMAERIHAFSPRANHALVRLNCAALPEALLESELFGYERGAFTGAAQHKEGYLVSADGGTVLLDEVGELPLATQAKLLRVIETREVTPVGALRPRAVDVRFIAATNRDLDALVRDGGFRADLFFRLNGVAIAIPPLRNRRGEIPGLARELVKRLCEAEGRARAPEITDRAMRALVGASWPGNVRELRNALERAIVLCRGGAIDVAHLPATIDAPSDPASPRTLKTDLASVERARITDALERSGGNQSRAAVLLGISRRTLVSRLDAHGLPRPRKKL
jgi:two-component system, NtrC family, response regulator AtoC